MDYEDDYDRQRSQVYLENAREFGQLQGLCRRLRKERNEARSKLLWLEAKLRRQGLWTSLVKEMEDAFSDG